MKHLLTLIALAILLALFLIGGEVMGQGSPIPSPTASWIPPPTRPTLTPTIMPADEGMDNPYPVDLPTRAPRATPTPGEETPPRWADAEPVATLTVLGQLVGTWWRSPEVACELYSDGTRIVRLVCP